MSISWKKTSHLIFVIIVNLHSYYKNIPLQQHPDIFNVFKSFLNDIKPKRILEIGTAEGGFTLFIRDYLNEIGLTDTTIKSFDIRNCEFHDEVRKNNIEINIENIFDADCLTLISPEKIIPYIQGDGVSLILCDGFNKKNEFNILAQFIKDGDFIMAHDYVKFWHIFIEEYMDKIWNWCEILESDVIEISKQQQLIHYNMENFEKVVWLCKQKRIVI